MRNGTLSPLAYCIAQFGCAGVLNIIVSTLYILIFYSMSNLGKDAEDYCYGIILVFLLLTFQDTVLLVISGVISDAIIGLISTIFVIGSVCLLSGFFVPVSDIFIWLRWICYALPTKVHNQMH